MNIENGIAQQMQQLTPSSKNREVGASKILNFTQPAFALMPPMAPKRNRENDYSSNI
jgi:hypothetical protein